MNCFRLYTSPTPRAQINPATNNKQISLIASPQMTFEDPESNVFTLAVQHVATGADKEQEKKKRTPAPTPGRSCPHHPPPALRCSLDTLRGPHGAANFRFHHAGERGPPMPRVSLGFVCCYCCCGFNSLCPAHELEEVRAVQERASAPAPPRFFPGDAKIRAPGVHRSHLSESSFALTSQIRSPKTRRAAGKQQGGGGVH